MKEKPKLLLPDLFSDEFDDIFDDAKKLQLALYYLVENDKFLTKKIIKFNKLEFVKTSEMLVDDKAGETQVYIDLALENARSDYPSITDDKQVLDIARREAYLFGLAYTNCHKRFEPIYEQCLDEVTNTNKHDNYERLQVMLETEEGEQKTLDINKNDLPSLLDRHRMNVIIYGLISYVYHVIIRDYSIRVLGIDPLMRKRKKKRKRK